MIDTSALLASRPVDIPAAQLQAQSLANLGTQNQLQKGALAMQPGQLEAQSLQNTAAGQENQQRAIDLKNQADTNAAIQKNIVTDPASGKTSINHDGVTNTLIQGGNAIAGMAYKKNADAIQLGIDNLGEANNKLQIAHADNLARVSASVLDTPPAARPAVYALALAGAIHNGQVQPGEMPATYDPSIDAQLNQLRGNSETQRTADAATATAKSKTDEDARKADQEYSGIVSNAYGSATDQASLDTVNKQLAAKLPAKYLPQLITQFGDGAAVKALAQSTLTAQNRSTDANSLAERKQAAANAANTQNYQAQELGVRRQEVGIQQQHLAIAQRAAAVGDDPLAGRSDADIQRLTAIADGTAPALNPRSKDYKADMDAVYAIDGTYKESRYLGQKAFTTGKDSDNLVTLTTALAHLDRAKTNSAALGFSPTQSLNITPGQHTFSADTNLLSGEIGKLVKNGAVSDTEGNRLIGNMHSSIQSNRDAALDELSQLMNGKIEGISQKYFNATGRAIPRSMYSPATQALMSKYNVGAVSDAAAPGGAPAAAAPAGSVSVIDGAGTSHVFPNQAQANVFRARVKAQGGVTR